MTIYAVGSGAGRHNWKFRRGQRKEVTGNSLELLGESFVEPLDIREVHDREKSPVGRLELQWRSV